MLEHVHALQWPQLALNLMKLAIALVHHDWRVLGVVLAGNLAWPLVDLAIELVRQCEGQESGAGSSYYKQLLGMALQLLRYLIAPTTAHQERILEVQALLLAYATAKGLVHSISDLLATYDCP